MSAKDTIKRIVDSFNSKPQLRDKTREMGEGLMLGASLADDANELSKTVQAQVDQLVVEGDSSVEAAQARVDGNGKSYTTLKNRLDEKEQEVDNKINNGLPHNEFKQGVGVFIFDDGFSSVLNNAYQHFVDYRVVANIAVITKNLESNNEGMMTAQDLLRLNSAGWELLSHGHDSYNMQSEGTGNNNAPYRDIELNSKVLAEKYGIELNGWVSPYGWIHKNHMKYVYKNYDFAYDSYSQDLTNYDQNIYNLNRIDLSTITRVQAENLIMKAKNEHKLLTFYCHGVSTTDNGKCDNSTAIRYLLSFFESNDVPIMTASKAMEYLFEKRQVKNIEEVDKIDLLLDSTSWTTNGSPETNFSVQNLGLVKRLKYEDTKASSVITALHNYRFVDIPINTTVFMDISFVVKAIKHNYNSKLTWRVDANIDGTNDYVQLFPDTLYQGFAQGSEKEFKIKLKIPNNINSKRIRLRFFYRSGETGSDDLTYVDNIVAHIHYVQ